VLLVYNIEHAIEQKRAVFDFLRGKRNLQIPHGRGRYARIQGQGEARGLARLIAHKKSRHHVGFFVAAER